MIELGQRKVFYEMPTLTIIVRDVHSTVVPLNNMCGIDRIYPHGVMIRVNSIVRGNGFPIFPAVITSCDIRPQAIYPICILWIYSQVGIVEWAIARLLAL